MKAIIASLIVAVPLPSFAQDDLVNLLKNPVSFDGSDIQISEIFEIVGMNLKPTPNVVFKGNAGEQKVNRLRVKDVTLGNLFKVIESVAEVEIEVIDDSDDGRGAPNDPFAGAPPSNRLTSSGVIIVSSKKPKQVVRGGEASMPLTPRPTPPKSTKVETEVISLAELKIPQEALIEAIKLTWDVADPTLSNRAKISFHEPSKLLIIAGSKEAIENAQKTVAALLPSYRELIQTKSKPQVMSYPMKNRTSTQLSLEQVPQIKKLFRPSTPPKGQNPNPDPGDRGGFDAGGGGLRLVKPPSGNVPKLDLELVPKANSLPRR